MTDADPRGAAEPDVAVAADRYDQMWRLAASFDAVGEEMRQRASLGAQVLADEGVRESQDLSPGTFREAEHEILRATTGRGGLLERSVELDADALMVRATVMTYRWIDELQAVAERTLGSVAGRAVGYLAPQVALGGAIVSAGLIETDSLDREGLAAYLNELADDNPELLDHVTSGGGGLLDRLQMRALLTVAALGGPQGRPAATAGLRAVGAEPFPADALDALRDVSGSYRAEPAVAAATRTGQAPTTRSLEELMTELAAGDPAATGPRVREVADGRFIVFLPGRPARRGELTLVGDDHDAEVSATISAVSAAVPPGSHVMLVGAGQGGAVATQLAAARPAAFTVDQVVTIASPLGHVANVPDPVRVLSLEDHADPVALLGSLINRTVPNRVTVVYDGGSSSGPASYPVGGRAADRAEHPSLRAELDRIRALGYLAG